VRPRAFLHLDALPRIGPGTVDRARLRALAGEAARG
jgi:hypothetical protein